MVDRRGTGPKSSEPAYNVFRIENTHLTNDAEIERFRADALQGISSDTEILQIDSVYPIDIDYSPLATCLELREVSINGPGRILKRSGKEKQRKKRIDLSLINMDKLQKMCIEIGIGVGEIDLDLTNLDRAIRLDELSLSKHTRGERIIPSLAASPRIKKVTLLLNNPTNIDFLVGNRSIEDIDITGMRNKSFDIGEINRCESLKNLRMQFINPATTDINLSQLSEVDSLETLRYAGPNPFKDTSRWIPLKSLRLLYIINTSPMSSIDLSPIAYAEELRTVSLAGISSKEIDFTPLKDNNSVEELVIFGHIDVEKIVVSGPRTLKQLGIHGFPKDEGSTRTIRETTRSDLHIDLKGLSGCSNLERLSLYSNPRVRELDLAPLRDLKSLRTLNLTTYSSRMFEYHDLQPLEDCDSLETLILDPTKPYDYDDEEVEWWHIDISSLFLMKNLQNVSIYMQSPDYKRDFVTVDGITTSSDICQTSGKQPPLRASRSKVPESLRTPSWSRQYKIRWY
ncbi:MAG: hypothetical protein ACXADL_06245 [Candidatus Thorarchaeota archaeon]|jgi:hypothetical protein